MKEDKDLEEAQARYDEAHDALRLVKKNARLAIDAAVIAFDAAYARLISARESAVAAKADTTKGHAP